VTPHREVADAYQVARPVTEGGNELKIIGADPVLDAAVEAAINAANKRVAAK
jgi:hypothetical protein